MWWLPAAADTSKCGAYEIAVAFKFDGSTTRGCLGVNAADLSADSGSIFYWDEYCGGQSEEVRFEKVGSRLKLEDFTYKYCEGTGADTARVVVTKMTATCFEVLDFTWLGARKTYYFKARPEPGCQ